MMPGLLLDRLGESVYKTRGPCSFCLLLAIGLEILSADFTPGSALAVSVSALRSCLPRLFAPLSALSLSTSFLCPLALSGPSRLGSSLSCSFRLGSVLFGSLFGSCGSLAPRVRCSSGSRPHSFLRSGHSWCGFQGPTC